MHAPPFHGGNTSSNLVGDATSKGLVNLTLFHFVQSGDYGEA